MIPRFPPTRFPFLTITSHLVVVLPPSVQYGQDGSPFLATRALLSLRRCSAVLSLLPHASHNTCPFFPSYNDTHSSLPPSIPRYTNTPSLQVWSALPFAFFFPFFWRRRCSRILSASPTRACPPDVSFGITFPARIILGHSPCMTAYIPSGVMLRLSSDRLLLISCPVPSTFPSSATQVGLTRPPDAFLPEIHWCLAFYSRPFPPSLTQFLSRLSLKDA